MRYELTDHELPSSGCSRTRRHAICFEIDERHGSNSEVGYELRTGPDIDTLAWYIRQKWLARSRCRRSRVRRRAWLADEEYLRLKVLTCVVPEL